MDNEFEQITCDIIADPLFQETRSLVPHGGENSVYDHSVATARTAYSLARRFGLSAERVRSLRGQLCFTTSSAMTGTATGLKTLTRQYSGWQRFRHMHAFIHGDIAAARAQERFGLTERQRAAIASHMFPLAFSMPRSSEASIITLADKIVASREMTMAVGYYTVNFAGSFFRRASDVSGGLFVRPPFVLTFGGQHETA